MASETTPIRGSIVVEKQVEMPKPKLPASFIIEDVDRRRSRIDFVKNRVIFHKIKQSIVVLTIFSFDSPPCRGMLPYLNDLQKRNRKNLFVIGLLIDKKLDAKRLRALMKRYHLNFFISNHPTNMKLADEFASILRLPLNYKIPLTIIYKNGKYIIHLSGATPPEMIQNIVDQIK